jgi:hypothetical protein
MPCMRPTPRLIQPVAAQCCSIRLSHKASNANQPLHELVARGPSAMHSTLKCPFCNPLELSMRCCMQSDVLVQAPT